MNRLTWEIKSMAPGKDPATTASQSAERQSVDGSLTAEASILLPLS